MVDCALVFPGQGAQFVGMGKDLYENFASARTVFDKANEILKYDLRKLCFEGPKRELSTTENSQPAILAASIAALRCFAQSELSRQFNPRFSLGLSLGEYTALVAAESLTFEDAIMLVRKRGVFMEETSRKNPGKMACIIGMELKAIEELCKGIGCEISNLNCPGQVVVSGKTTNVELLASLVKEKGAKRVVILDVNGPFHSSLMAPAKDKLKDFIEKIQILPPRLSFVSNVDAKVHTDPTRIKDNLIRQVDSRTLWEESIKTAAAGGVKAFLEIGPGQVLKGLIRKIDPKLEVKNFGTSQDLQPVSI